MTDFSKLLNPEQCAAATAGEGPLLVLAAAGTGKTRTLVHRVAYLIEQGVPPERILLLTFTNRAAKEMLERAEKVVGDAAQSIWSGTFHSICARFLRRYGSALGYQPGFQIIDEEDQKKLIGDIIKSSVKDPKDFPKKELIAKMKAAERVFLVTTPSFLERFCAYADQYEVPQNCVEIVTSGALLTAPVSAATKRVFGLAPREIFGSTETGGVAWRRQDEPDCPWRVFAPVTVRTE